jgi:hypothetical protein
MLAGRGNGVTNMSTSADRNRVALAMFQSSQNLCRALGDFDKAGLASQQMGLAGRASAMSDFIRSFHASETKLASAEQLIGSIEPLAMTAGQEGILASGGPLWPALQCFGTAPSDALVSARWMEPRLRDELTAHINNGAILFGVRAASVDQQKICTHILLQHSSHRVHTHEFNL